jgi:hypothetical protein
VIDALAVAFAVVVVVRAVWVWALLWWASR